MKTLTDANVYYKESIVFESNNFARVLYTWFVVPVLNRLPARTINFITKSHKSAEVVIENKTNHYALEILYQEGKTFKSYNAVSRALRNFWFHTNNACAVRNRLKIVKAELERDITERINRGQKEIQILNIAAGSARAVLETINNFKGQDVKFIVTFLDKNPVAIEYSKALASKLNLTNANLTWVVNTIGAFFKDSYNEGFDIIEMVGLLDYFDDNQVTSVIKNIHKHLNDRGFFITANIVKNREYTFVTKVIGWSMKYRFAKDLRNLINKSGFPSESITMYYEPLHIHTIASVYK